MVLGVTIATCSRWPELSASDRLYAEALAERGLAVRAALWNGPDAPFACADAVLLRSTWDYHHELDAFVAWLERLRQGGTRVFNPVELVRWNLDKRYLLDLAAGGVALPGTCVVAPEAAAVARAMAATGWERAVLKPAAGASGHLVRLVRREAVATALDGLDPAAGRPYLLQEFMPEVRAGELACVFFNGDFSHAFARVPAADEFRVNSQYGGRLEPRVPGADVVHQARAVLDALAQLPLYARVDGVLRDGRFILMELELIEPGLALDLAPDAADRFADATLQRLFGSDEI